MINHQHYTYRIIWSDEDQEFVGLCAEYPSLSYLAIDDYQALQGIKKLVQDVMKDMEEQGEEIPVPISQRNYSGKFQVRILPELHRKLAIEATEANVSLNRYISNKLASSS